MDNTEQQSAAPPTLNHVIGQKRAVQQLKIALDAYYNDRAVASAETAIALPHVLLLGPAGVGKSMMAALIARELCSNCHEELAQNLITTGHLHGLLMMAEPGDVIFVDEIHELENQVCLYRALEERRLFLHGNSQSITLPPFTFVAATTDEWLLSKPMRDRFKIVLRLEHYSADELTELIRQRCKLLKWGISDDAITGIASRGRGTPRLAIRILDAARRVCRSENADTITAAHLKRSCEVEGIDDLGLDSLERRYLELLRTTQGPVRLNVLATQLGLPRRTIESVVEVELLRLNLISKGDGGRMLTSTGIEHLKRTS